MKRQQLDRHEDHFILSRKTKLGYGMSGFGQSIVQDVANNYILLLYNTQLMVPSSWIGAALSFSRLSDAFVDPIIGHISDNTRSRWGRRRPYILFGSFLLMLSFWALCIPPGGLSEKGYFVYLAIAAFVYYTFLSVVMVPDSALGAELSLDYHERTRLYACRTLLGRFGGLGAAGCWLLASQFSSIRTGFIFVGVGFGLLSFLSLIITFMTTSENAEVQRQAKVSFVSGIANTINNGPFWILVGIIFFLQMGVLLGFPAARYLVIYHIFGGETKAAAPVLFANDATVAITSILCIAPLSMLSKRLGKERALLLGILAFAVAPLISWFVFVPEHPYLSILFQIPAGFALASVNIFPGAMVADLVDLDELRTNRRREGMYSAVLSFVFKLAPPLGILGFTQLLDHWAHFDPKLPVQDVETILHLRLMLLFMPLIPLAISLTCALIYPVREKRIREVRALLEVRRAERLREESSEV